MATKITEDGKTYFVALMDLEKDTKNTVRFQEDTSDGAPVSGTLYVQKYAMTQMGNPKRVKVTVEPLDD